MLLHTAITIVLGVSVLWGYCQSELNPADGPSRGLPISHQLKKETEKKDSMRRARPMEVHKAASHLCEGAVCRGKAVEGKPRCASCCACPNACIG